MRLALVLLVLSVLVGVAWLTAPRGAPLGQRPQEITAATPSSPSVVLQPPRRADRRSVPAEAATEQETGTVLLEVFTVESYARDALPVSGVAFEVRRVGDGPTDPPVASGVTDAGGKALVALPGDLAVWKEPGEPNVLGMVADPQYQSRRANPREASEGGPPRLKLRAHPGSTAVGRVVDLEGRGVEAVVRLHESRGGAPPPFVGRRATELGGGWFHHHVRADVSGVFVAESEVAGTGTLAVELSAVAPPRDLVVVVRGPGVVRGRVYEGPDAPAAGLQLRVGLAELETGRGGSRTPNSIRTERLFEGRGRLQAEVTTDADGRFEVRGLRDDEYVVRARTRSRDEDYQFLLTEHPVPADGTRLELELHRPHLVVHVQDEDGGPWRGAMVTGYRYSRNRDLHAWPEEPVLIVRDAGSKREPVVASWPRLQSSLEQGVLPAVFEVDDDRRYLVGALGGGFDGRMALVDVPPGSGRVEVVVRRPPRCVLGSVAVTLASEGRELRGEGGEPEFRLWLEHVETCAVLLTRYEYLRETRVTFDVPPGRYRLVATGAPSVDHHHGTLLRPRTLGRVEAEVEVVSDTTAEVGLDLGPGGSLAVSLTGEARDEDVRAVRERFPGVSAEWLETLSRSASLSLLRGNRRPEAVLRQARDRGSYGPHLCEDWPLGETHGSEILPAGNYVLLARMPGGREARASVAITAGETTDVRLDL